MAGKALVATLKLLLYIPYLLIGGCIWLVAVFVSLLARQWMEFYDE